VSQKDGPIWWQADPASIHDIRRLLANLKPVVLYHLAGAAGAKPDLELVLPTFEGLVISAVNVLVAGTEAGCRRIVLTGSLTEPTAVDHAPVPSSPYAAAKWASTAYARMFHLLYESPTVVLTPFMTFGPGQDKSKLVPSVICSLLRREAPRLSSGLWEVDWIFIEDVIEALLASAMVQNIEGACIDVGTGTKRSVRSVVEQIARLMGNETRPLFGVLPDRPLESTRSANTVYAYQRLKWQPQTSFEEGLRQTIAWYTAHVSAGHG
jgi:nucleoside-diphosphate-sugar epimerase